VREEKKKKAGVFGRAFLYHLELGGGERLHYHLDPTTCRLGGETLKSRGGSVSDSP
jgi:hypothetical protein